MEKFKLLYEGKVREVYDIGDKLVIAATDLRCLNSGLIILRMLFLII